MTCYAVRWDYVDRAQFVVARLVMTASSGSVGRCGLMPNGCRLAPVFWITLARAAFLLTGQTWLDPA